MKNFDKFLFVGSLFVCAYWFLAFNIDVYKYAIVGAIYELLWLPALALIYVLPIVNLYFWVKAKFRLKSLYLYGFMVTTLSLLSYQLGLLV